jgi:hypothetical protein
VIPLLDRFGIRVLVDSQDGVIVLFLGLFSLNLSLFKLLLDSESVFVDLRGIAEVLDGLFRVAESLLHLTAFHVGLRIIWVHLQASIQAGQSIIILVLLIQGDCLVEKNCRVIVEVVWVKCQTLIELFDGLVKFVRLEEFTSLLLHDLARSYELDRLRCFLEVWLSL